MRTIFCVTTLLLSAGTAFATGGIWCSAEDAAVKFEVEAGVTRGMGGPTFNFRGDLEILGRPVGDGLRKSVFEDSNLTQYWLDGKELRLLVYREHEVANTYSSVELTILTKASEEGVYDGRYSLAIYDGTAAADKDDKPVELTGKVSCGAE
ncbi:MAG: hypothetical protein E5Y88_12000 [Mesorhizobium sp.]|uniref:hypothetical protein n=1 Tax=unclassified Mesorhizobium TaxID=325217 RepID=UPI000FD5FC2F|nr:MULTISPECIES: hypothetical protein [unclassified Mesorhizobium]RVB76847.1 hypothetical protein EN885_14550 [Mesorhizobium sp. M6A.T.Cr.TU.014.01.1.1]RWP78007.1 MAG: hypothetical protein EOR10_13510 [Mesorhizobium sp.]RWQ05706.1 MAG: hypothetical protein EOR90_13715 [Mesorhizobium sp.]RWQ07109.1 MAG: hypothetical protein EOR91_12780 [Mesorhizobium sp.]RWQ39098.1 MAG: hypothetical protein EOS20_07020 [Mesorhizobium sp.]